MKRLNCWFFNIVLVRWLTRHFRAVPLKGSPKGVYFRHLVPFSPSLLYYNVQLVKPFPPRVKLGNRPLPHFQNDARCRTFLVKMSFICVRMKNDFLIKGWAPTLVLKQKPGETRKWPIVLASILHKRTPLNMPKYEGRRGWTKLKVGYWKTVRSDSFSKFISIVKKVPFITSAPPPKKGRNVKISKVYTNSIF